MNDGTLVFPAQYWDELGVPYSTIVYSKDKGLSWKRGSGAKANTTESQVVETSSGQLMLNMRDNRGGFRSVMVTNDMGMTWQEHASSSNSLIDPVCMASFIKANVNWKGTMKDILFFSNPASSKSRDMLTIKASEDLGATWKIINAQLIDARQSYGYSSLTLINKNTIGILYEGKGDLYFMRIPIVEFSRE
jgi:sialidase-1